MKIQPDLMSSEVLISFKFCMNLIFQFFILEKFKIRRKPDSLFQ